ncbi:putative membrane protein, required for colicin V production [Desulfocapsa sulfexigens DSM 10523]|uniref:Putative membrane protein, required for colicin V production n=1 Tax=Desulfocapsa sulfexigens (strain DSM 10523 / SB164P1) TaxID=1167006 RepID=M1NF62_DESSD|nr:CvpA family protein [Desulfocapsa sulfexigens]AGF78319.1 putative membrane protein, required for colicin V production [Desulfocapsa sulfexigens DSM 10523]
MANAFHLTGFDFVIIALLLLFTLRGLWVGFLSQVTTLVALLVGYVIAGQYHDKLFPFLRGVTENPHAVFWTSYVILFGFTYVVTMLLGKGLAKVVELTVAGWFDKLLGGVLGMAKAFILVVLLNMVLSGLLAPENDMLRKCQLCPYLTQATDFFRSLIKDDTIRKTFLQSKPAISEKKPSQEKPLQEKPPADGVRPFVPTVFPEK